VDYGSSLYLLGAVVFFLGLAGIVLAEHHWQPASLRIESQAKFAGNYLKLHWKSTLAGGLVWWMGFGPFAGFAVLLVLHLVGRRRPATNRPPSWDDKKKHWTDMRESEQQQWVASLGRTPEERIHTINEIFDRKEQTLRIVLWWDEKAQFPYSVVHMGVRMSRNLAAMDTRHRESLRNVELLAAAGVDKEWCAQKKFGLLWGDGKASIEEHSFVLHDTTVKDASAAVNSFVSQWSLSVEAVVNDVLHRVESLGREAKPNTTLAEALGSIKGRQMGGAGWFSPRDLPNKIFSNETTRTLRLGVLEGTDIPLAFSGEGSLITVAPPGSGKTQCHVIPSLLNWDGPAIVLDVKGELYEEGHRRSPAQANGGRNMSVRYTSSARSIRATATATTRSRSFASKPTYFGKTPPL
jgi:hypothetical protein